MQAKISIIIPAYNEGKKVYESVSAIHAYMISEKFDNFEIIISNDGSKDDTLTWAENIKMQLDKIVVLNNQHKGKGAAVKAGMLSATGDYLIFTDADLSTPVDEISKMVDMLKNYKAVIGSRKEAESNILIKQPMHRRIMSNVYANLASKVIGKKFSDTQCGFKGFHKALANIVFSDLENEQWSFDVELLRMIVQMDIEIGVLPIKWRHEDNSKINSLFSPLKMFLDLIEISRKKKMLTAADLESVNRDKSTLQSNSNLTTDS
jgi:dolichyl-phosphate beta-glucosyltransferase